MRDHAAGPRTISYERAIHDGKHTAMDFFLDHQQVHESFVDDRMSPMSMLVEQAAERVFHRARGRRKNMRFYGRQVDDVLANEPFGNGESLFVYIVENEEVIRQIAHGISDVNPVFSLI